MRLRNVIAVGVIAGLALTACSSGGDSTSDGPSNQPNTVDIAVASQIRPVVDKLAATYKTANPGKKVAVSGLDQAQISTAISDKTADVAVGPSGWLGATPTAALGRNVLVIAVPTANPGNVAGLSAFGNPGLRTTICGIDSSIGDFTLAILRRAKVTPRSSSISTSADCPTKAMTAVASGQLDAAVFYRNNVPVPAGAKTIAVPDEQNFAFPIDYAVVGDNADASSFRTFLGSSQARTILTDNGYLP
jgi:ABC-type molybdate transport system substrate-binding protein